MSNTACAKGSVLVSIPWLSSKENEENTGQAMSINGARSPSVEGKAGQRWKHRWKASMTRQCLKHRNLTACLCLGRQEDAWSLAGCGEWQGGVRKQQWKQR